MTWYIPRDQGIMHNRLVRLVLEIGVPSLPEYRTHLFQLLFCGANLDASINTVCSKRACAICVPLVKYFFLHLRVTPQEVVEGVGVGFSTVYRECKVVILDWMQTSDNFGPTARKIDGTHTWKFSPTPGRSINGLTPARLSFSGLPVVRD